MEEIPGKENTGPEEGADKLAANARARKMRVGQTPLTNSKGSMIMHSDHLRIRLEAGSLLPGMPQLALEQSAETR